MKTSFDIVFVVLVYRNTNDLKDFFETFTMVNSKVVVVNSFYDEASETEFATIAKKYNADFLSVPNKGYGAGNNAGIKYTLENYTYKYLVISNADVKIEKLSTSYLEKYNNSIIAPRIINLSGKNQNPNSPYAPTKLEAWLKYIVYKGQHRKMIWLLYAYSRFKKVCFSLTSLFCKKIFSAHGAFVILPYNVIQKLHPLYNEDMFLFYEESHLAKYARERGINTYYESHIVINHKEDGSMKIANINLFDKERQSYEVYYNKWYKK